MVGFVSISAAAFVKRWVENHLEAVYIVCPMEHNQVVV